VFPDKSNKLISAPALIKLTVISSCPLKNKITLKKPS